MNIINQDRDQLFKFSTKEDLHIIINTERDVIISYNLNLKDNFLGSFETLEEVLNEIYNISSCTYDYYIISGFQDYEECFRNYKEI